MKENHSYIVRHLYWLTTEIQRNRRIENKTDYFNWKLNSFSCKFLTGRMNSHTPQCRVFIVIMIIFSFARFEQTNWWKPVFKHVSLLTNSKNFGGGKRAWLKETTSAPRCRGYSRKRKRRKDQLAIKSYRELIRKITHDWFLWGFFFFPRATKCFFCRNCFQMIILSVKLAKPKRAYPASIISTIQALFELNSDMRHGLETATWESRNDDTKNDIRRIETTTATKKVQIQ